MNIVKIQNLQQKILNAVIVDEQHYDMCIENITVRIKPPILLNNKT